MLPRLLRMLPLALVAVATVGCATQATTGSLSPERVVLYEGATLIPGDDRAAVLNSAFLVEGEKITRVGRKGELTLPKGAERVDLSGKTVMPTLVNAHSHPGKLSRGPESVLVLRCLGGDVLGHRQGRCRAEDPSRPARGQGRRCAAADCRARHRRSERRTGRHRIRRRRLRSHDRGRGETGCPRDRRFARRPSQDLGRRPRRKSEGAKP